MTTVGLPLQIKTVNPVRVFAAVLILAVGVGILVAASANRRSTDFLCYWASGQQLAHHHNPYESTQVLAIERSAGYKALYPEFMRNPPPALLMAYPFGFLGARAGAVLWMLIMITALMSSVHMLWLLNGRRSDGIKLLAYCFPPVMACLVCAQVGTILLLGAVLFLYFHRTRPLLAGCGLALCAFKPHLFVPFGVVLLLWSITRRSYRPLLGAAVLLILATAFVLCLDPHIFSHYSQMMRSDGIADEFIPTLSSLFRIGLDRRIFALQFVPSAIASIWGVWYFLRNRVGWNWNRNGLLLLVVSIAVAPYAWFTDEVVVLPAILAALYAVTDMQRSFLPFLLLGGIAFFEVLANVNISSGFYCWTTLAWFALYRYSRGASPSRCVSAANYRSTFQPNNE